MGDTDEAHAAVASFETMRCKLGAQAINDGGGITTVTSNLWVTFRQTATPIFHRTSPQVVYFNQEVDWHLSVQSAPAYRNLNSETPFRIGFIDESNTNYEIWLNETTEMSTATDVIITGQTGDAAVNATSIPRINFHSGDAMRMEDEMMTCNYDESDCYLMKNIAVVDSFDYDTGYVEGGQWLYFKGVRLLGPVETTVTVDGVECEIVEGSLTKEEGKCITGAAGAASVDGVDYIGSSGLRRAVYVSDEAIDLDDIEGTADHDDTKLLTAFEYNVHDDFQASITSGWFVPEVTGTYKFYAVCDDRCALSLSTTSKESGGDSSSPAEILRIDSQTYIRTHWWNDASSTFSLTGGEHYFIELRHVNDGATGYAAVHVELQSSATSSHPQAKKEVQELEISATDLVFDTTVITVENPDDGTFNLKFTHTGGVNEEDAGIHIPEETVEIPTLMTASTCKSGVSAFFSDIHGT